MEMQEKKMYREIQMSALSLQIPAVRLVAGGARQRQQQRGRHQHQQPALHRQGPGGDQGVLYSNLGSDSTWYAHKACLQIGRYSM